MVSTVAVVFAYIFIVTIGVIAVLAFEKTLKYKSSSNGSTGNLTTITKRINDLSAEVNKIIANSGGSNDPNLSGQVHQNRNAILKLQSEVSSLNSYFSDGSLTVKNTITVGDVTLSGKTTNRGTQLEITNPKNSPAGIVADGRSSIGGVGFNGEQGGGGTVPHPIFLNGRIEMYNDDTSYKGGTRASIFVKQDQNHGYLNVNKIYATGQQAGDSSNLEKWDLCADDYKYSNTSPNYCVKN